MQRLTENRISSAAVPFVAITALPVELKKRAPRVLSPVASLGSCKVYYSGSATQRQNVVAKRIGDSLANFQQIVPAHEGSDQTRW